MINVHSLAMALLHTSKNVCEKDNTLSLPDQKEANETQSPGSCHALKHGSGMRQILFVHDYHEQEEMSPLCLVSLQYPRALKGIE